MQEKITLVCVECRQHECEVDKAQEREQRNRVEFWEYCDECHRHTKHREHR
jgi:ribosomal protein L33